MNPELPLNPGEEMESRLTALLLGELNAAEAAAVRAAMARDPQLARLHDDLKQTIQLVREAATESGAGDSAEAVAPTLSESRRTKLRTAFAIPALRESDWKPQRSLRLSLVEAIAVLAIVGVLASILFPAAHRVRSRGSLSSSFGEEHFGNWFARSEKAPANVTPLPAAPVRVESLDDSADAIPEKSKAGSVAGPSNVYSVNVVGYTSVDPKKLSTLSASSIALPQVTNVTNSDSDSYGEKMIDKPLAVADANGIGAEAEGRRIVDALTFGKAEVAGDRAVASSPAPTEVLSRAPVSGAYVSGTYHGGGYGGGGGAGGRSGGGEKVTGVTPKSQAAEPVFGDVPQLGKVFRGKTQLSGATDSTATLGQELSDGRAGGVLPSGPLTLNYELQRATPPQTWSVSSSARGFYNDGSIAATAIVDPATGLPVAPTDTIRPGEVAPSPSPAAALPALQPEPATERRRFMERYGLASRPKRPAVAEPAKGDGKGLADKLQQVADGTQPSRGSADTPEISAERRQLTERSGISGSPVGSPVPGKPAVAEAPKFEMEITRSLKRRKPVAEATPQPTLGGATDSQNLPAEEKLSGELRPVILAENEGKAAQALGENLNSVVLSEGQNVPGGPAPVAVGRVLRMPPSTTSQQRQAVPNFNGPTDKVNVGDPAVVGVLEVGSGKEGFKVGQEPDISIGGTYRLETDPVAQEIPPQSVSDGERGVNKGAIYLGAPAGEGQSATRPVERKRGELSEITTSQPELAKPPPEQLRQIIRSTTELEKLTSLARVLSTQLTAEKLDTALPKNAMVELVGRAEPAKGKSGVFRSLGIPAGGDYESTARVKIDRHVTDIQGLGSSRAGSAYDPYFVQTEFEVMQSEPVLSNVVEKLKLDEAWAKPGTGQKLKLAEAIGLLKQKVELKPVKDTGLVEVKVRDKDSKEAADIANSVAESYQEHRSQARKELGEGAIKALEGRYKETLSKIYGGQKELAALNKGLGISGARYKTPAPVLDPATGLVTPSAPTASDPETGLPTPRRSATNAPVPPAEIQTSENAFSTFSLNVSDVSYKLALASLEQGQLPDPASIRTEEFINAFDYRDPDPPAGVPIAFAWERARYPFAHNRDMLRFSLKTAALGREAGRPLNVVLLLDNSGSMERADRVRIIHEGLRVLATQLHPRDILSVITFARTPRLWVDGVSGDQAAGLADQVDGLTPQGGTNLEDAMKLAYQTALRHYRANGLNRVVLLTDGAANLGNVDPTALKEMVEAHRKQGIALDCFGIGWEGYNDDLLETLSRNGDGRYGFINSPEAAASEFAGQLAGALQVAASDVKVQVEFNPSRTTAYRQIGYAKHQLKQEQFRDNTVDAAEIAAQEAGNALYAVEVNPAGAGPLCTVRVRYKIPGTGDYREQAWEVPYNGNAPALEQASPAMRLATGASSFGEWLAASPYAGEVSLDRVLQSLGGVSEIFGANARPKQLEWMIRQAKSLDH